ncbi:MAG: ComEC/Rec2 family competence protein [bacterium]|nr:ComEC/Rec2 family competence protein [bacterium]
MIIWPLSRITRWCALSFLVGIALYEWIRVSWVWAIVVVWIGIVMISWRHHQRIRILGCCILFFSIGLLRSISAIPIAGDYNVSVFNAQSVHQWEGVIVKEPDVRETKQKLTVNITDYNVGNATYNGLILIDAPSYPWFGYGDHVTFGCELEEPFVAEGFSYKDYLARQGIFSWCRKPTSIMAISGEHSSFVLTGLYSFKKWMVSGINTLLPEPHSTLLSGILFGARSAFPKNVASSFSIVGLTHIVAISGYNITVVMVAIASLFRAVRIGRKRATWAILAGVTLFTLFTGASSSTIRAALMGGLVLIAQHKGRTQNVAHTLLIAGVVMVALSPSVLFHDAGFQLSFLATMGLLYGTPILSHFIDKLPIWKWAKEISTQTLAATLATIPLIVVQFSSLSLISLLANILVLPFIPFSMVIGFILVVMNMAGTLLGPFAPFWQIIVTPVAWGTWLVLEYILKITDYLSRIPYASVSITLQSWSWVFFVFSYGLLFFIVWSYHRIHTQPSVSTESQIKAIALP